MFEKFRVPDSHSNYAAIMLNILPKVFLLAAVCCFPLSQFFKWNVAFYAGGLIAYYTLMAIEVFGPDASLPEKLVISKKRERWRTIALVTIGSFVITAAFPSIKTSTEIWRPIFVVFLGCPFLLSMVVCLSRRLPMPKVQQGEEKDVGLN